MTASVFEYRVKSRLPEGAMEERWRHLAPDDDYSLLLTGPTRVYKPDGKLLLHYIPAAFAARTAEFWDTLYELRKYETGNRGYASGTQSYKSFEGSTRERTVPVASAIVGAFDAQPPYFYCRLSAFVQKDFEKYASLFPLLHGIGALFAESVPDRYTAQMNYVNRTHPDWVIRHGDYTTPFTTVTVNVSYPTGYHTDKGDLDEGFSCLTVFRKGDYRGGRLVFPEYRIAADLQNGDQLLMDAHAAHGNTQLYCGDCGEPMGPGQPVTTEDPARPGWRHFDATGQRPEHWRWDHELAGCAAARVSVVSYYRTQMEACGSSEEEAEKAAAWAERKSVIAEGRTMQDLAVEQMAADSVPIQ